MKLIKKNKDLQIFKKNSGRYAVAHAETGKFLAGEEKVKVLLNHKLIKLTPAKPKAEAAPAEAPASS